MNPAISNPLAAGLFVHEADHISISAARDLLDWLEGQGIESREVVLEADGTMSVRWLE